MTPDQFEKLNALSEKLTDVLLFDADPENWVGVGIPASQLSREERGDAYWCRKVATASVSVLLRVNSIIDDRLSRTKPHQEDEADLDKEIAAAEKEALKLLDRLHKREVERKDFVEASISGRRKK